MTDYNPEKNGGLLRGADGRLQGRKLAAILCFLLGIGLLIYGAVAPGAMTLEVRVGPALVALVFALLFWGLLTVQNVFQLLALLKGQPLPPAQPEKEEPHGR
jgi:hypothetical protein